MFKLKKEDTRYKCDSFYIYNSMDCTYYLAPFLGMTNNLSEAYIYTKKDVIKHIDYKGVRDKVLVIIDANNQFVYSTEETLKLIIPRF